MEENKRKHLELIQNAITRMSNNLFFLRGWTITLITGILAILLQGNNMNSVYVLYLPIIIFWVLDGYFLSQERLFRSLYNHVRSLDAKDIDFTMDTTPYSSNCRNTWFFSMFSSTLLIFYAPIMISLIIVTLLFT